MGWTNTNVDTLVIPTGATTGARIVLDGVTGVITVYDASNNVSAEISSVPGPTTGIMTEDIDGSFLLMSPQSPATLQINPADVVGHTFAFAQVGAEHEAAPDYIPRLFLLSPTIDSRAQSSISL